MKNISLFILFASFCFSINAQDIFRLQLDEYQQVENKDGRFGSQLKFPNSNASVVMGGLNDLDGMNNYFNIFGSKLIIHSSTISNDGTQKVVLRREDGKNFFDIFPKVSATLIPIGYDEYETD